MGLRFLRAPIKPNVARMVIALAVIILIILILAGVTFTLRAGKDKFAVCPDGKTRCDGCQCCPGGTVCSNAPPGCNIQCGYALCPDGKTHCNGCQCCPDGTLCPNAQGCPPNLCPGGGIPWTPIGPPQPPAGQMFVQLVNATGTTLLAGALGPTPVLPKEGRWDFGPGESLTIIIPDSWKHTAGSSHINGPRFWVRTGCKFDAAADKAQCETGDCGGRYDCSKAGLAGVAPASLAEFCFVCGDDMTYYDVSLVDGYTLSVDIQPVGPHSASHPGNPTDPQWCTSGLCKAGADLRAICPDAFALKRSQLVSYVPGTPDATIACFSNCGRYEYPTAPLANCPDSDPRCAPWRQYCCQSSRYGQKCETDADCDYGGACWNGVCSCRAYYRNMNCPPDVCTFPGGAWQPAAQQCNAPSCIGDDTIHGVCPRAYTWPNDPQTYNCDALGYRITFGPGWGSLPNFPISPSGPIPRCSDLPSQYFDEAAGSSSCGTKGTFACAKTIASGLYWDCDVDTTGCNGVVCRW